MAEKNDTPEPVPITRDDVDRLIAAMNKLTQALNQLPMKMPTSIRVRM